MRLYNQDYTVDISPNPDGTQTMRIGPPPADIGGRVVNEENPIPDTERRIEDLSDEELEDLQKHYDDERNDPVIRALREYNAAKVEIGLGAVGIVAMIVFGIFVWLTWGLR